MNNFRFIRPLGLQRAETKLAEILNLDSLTFRVGLGREDRKTEQRKGVLRPPGPSLPGQKSPKVRLPALLPMGERTTVPFLLLLVVRSWMVKK